MSVFIFILLFYTRGVSLESEWQQVSLGLQDSFQYSGRSEHCFSLFLRMFNISSHFTVILGTVPSLSTITVISVSLMFHTLFLVLRQGSSICLYFRCLLFLVSRVFANSSEDQGSIPGLVIPKTLKMVLDTSLLNTQHYKVLIKSKEDNPGNGVAPSPTPRCSSYWKGAFVSPSTTVANFTYLLIFTLWSARTVRSDRWHFISF